MTRLWRRYKHERDEEARNELVLAHLPLVRYILGRLPISLPSGVSAEDLASAGVVALMSAIESFDPSRGVEFATFAVPRIRGSMFDELRHHDTIPRAVRQRANAIEAACVELSRQGNKTPSLDEIAAAVGSTAREVESTMAAVGFRNYLSVNSFCRTTSVGQDQIMESAADASAPTPLAALMAKERASIVSEAIADLPEADRRVITLYYRDGLMLKEIAEVLSVTKARVSQIHARALFRLRARIADLAGGQPPPIQEAAS